MAEAAVQSCSWRNAATSVLADRTNRFQVYEFRERFEHQDIIGFRCSLLSNRFEFVIFYHRFRLELDHVTYVTPLLYYYT